MGKKIETSNKEILGILWQGIRAAASVKMVGVSRVLNISEE